MVEVKEEGDGDWKRRGRGGREEGRGNVCREYAGS